MLTCGAMLQMFNNIKYKMLKYSEVKIRTDSPMNQLFLHSSPKVAYWSTLLFFFGAHFLYESTY